MDKLRWKLVLVAALCAAPVGAGAQDAGDPDFAAAQQLVTQKKYAEAVPALEKFLAAFPKHDRVVQARLALGESLLALEKPDAAARAYQAALAAMPAPDLRTEALLGLGRARLALQQDQAALEALTEAFDLTAQDPRNGPVASILYGDALTRLGRYTDAARAYDRVERWPTHPEAPRAHYLVGESYRRAGNLQEAAITLRLVSEKYWRQPFAPQAGVHAGEAFLALGRYAEAEREFRRVLKEYLESPAAPRAQLGLGDVAAAQKNFGVARQAYQAAALVFEAAGIAPEAELRIANTYLAEKNVAEARARYEKLIASVDRGVAGEAWHSLGETYAQAGDLGKAAETFARLGGDRTTGRWWRRGLIRLAEIRFGAGDMETGIATLRAVLADNPPRAEQDEAQTALGSALLKRGEFAAAERELRAVAERTPAGAHTRHATVLVARCRVEQGDAAGALAGVQPLLGASLPPELRAVALTTVGRARLLLKQPEGADSLREVLENHPETPVAAEAARALLGHLRDTRQDKQADELEALIARRYPGVLVAVDGILGSAAKELQAGRYAEAAKLYQKALDSKPDRAARLKARAGLVRVSAAQKQRAETDRELALLKKEGAAPEQLARAMVEVAAAFEDAGQPAVALDYYRQARETGSDGETAPTLLLAMSRLLTDAGKSAEAAPLLDELLTKYPKSPAVPGALYAQAWSRLERRETAAAVPLLERLVKGYPQHPLAADASFRLGEVAFDAGNLAAAVERYRVAAAAKEAVAEPAGYKLGWALRRLAKHEEAAKAFQVVADRFPKGPLATEARIRAGEALLELEEEAAALEQFEAAIKGARPEESKLLVQAKVGAAFARLMQGDFDAARALAEEAAVPANGWYGGRAQLVRAEALFLKEGAKAALVEYARGASLFARYKDLAGEAQFRVGECHEKLGDLKAARAAWQRVVDLYGETVWAERSRDRMSRPASGAAG